MGGEGSFTDARTGVSVINGLEDLVTDKLPALQEYQLTLKAPPPPAGSFDAEAAARGEALFDGAATCATCHSGPEFTDANERLHAPADVVGTYNSRLALGLSDADVSDLVEYLKSL
jgi:mono/diheme cytochrome c family protein